jgi:hypothetical protein
MGWALTCETRCATNICQLITWPRAVSSVGRASRLHREGRRFESVTAHQKINQLSHQWLCCAVSWKQIVSSARDFNSPAQGGVSALPDQFFGHFVAGDPQKAFIRLQPICNLLILFDVFFGIFALR